MAINWDKVHKDAKAKDEERTTLKKTTAASSKKINWNEVHKLAQEKDSKRKVTSSDIAPSGQKTTPGRTTIKTESNVSDRKYGGGGRRFTSSGTVPYAKTTAPLAGDALDALHNKPYSERYNATDLLKDISLNEDKQWTKVQENQSASKNKSDTRNSADVQKEIDALTADTTEQLLQDINTGKNSKVWQYANKERDYTTKNRFQNLEAEKEHLEQTEKYAQMSDEELSAANEKYTQERKKYLDERGGAVKYLLDYTVDVAKSEELPERSLADIDKEHNYVKSEMSDRTTQKYLYSMSNEERELIARVNAKEQGYDIDDNTYGRALHILKTKYGLSDDDITAKTYYWNRYANKNKAIREDLDARSFANKHSVFSSLISVPENMIGGIASIGGIVDSYLENREVEKAGIESLGIDYNNPWNSFSREAQSFRNEFKDTHDWKIGNFDVGDFLYDTALSGAESILASAIPGKYTGSLILGINEATSKTHELSQRGLSDGKAIMGGVFAGVAATVFEEVSIGNIKAMSAVTPKSIKDVAWNVAKGMGVNFQEEAATEIANIFYDTIVNGELSDYSIQMQQLMKSGLSRTEAQKQALIGHGLQVIEAGASGALMGAGFSSASTANYIGNNLTAAANGDFAKRSNLTSNILAMGNAAPEGSRAHKLAQSAVDKKGNVNSRKLGLLAQENAEYIANQQKPTIGIFAGVETAGQVNEKYNAEKTRIHNDSSIPASFKGRRFAALESEYSAAKEALKGLKTAGRMQRAADNATENFARKKQKNIDELSKVKVTNPEIETASGKATVDGGNFNPKGTTLSEFKGIFKDKDGDNAVKTTKGETIKVSELIKQMPDKVVARLYEEANKKTAEAANLFIENYDGDDISEYGRAFDYYYNMGRAGMSVEDIRKNDGIFGTYLSADAQEQIATAGLKDREFKAGVTDLSVGKKNLLYKAESWIINTVAQQFGNEVIILDENAKINGSYLRGTNRIVIYRNAEGGVLLRTAAHEVYHFIEQWSPENAAKLRDYTFKALKESGVDIEQALKKYERNGYATRDEQISDFVADSMFDVFTNKKFIMQLAKENMPLTKKLLSRLEAVTDAIKSKIEALGMMKDREGRELKPEIKALKDEAEKLDNIRAMFMEGYKQASESFKQHNSQKDAGNEQKNNAAETAADKSSGIQFSQKELYDSNMQNTIDGYLEAVDETLLSFIQKYYENPNEDFDRLTLSAVGKKQAADLKRLSGIDFSGYSNAINKSAVNHVNKRHGENGKQDNSMSNINDFARLKFVIDNYDDIEILKLEDGDVDLSKEFRNSDNTPAKLIRMKKKVNGTFYVVEAVAENKYKKIWVASAYIQKNGAVTQVPTTKSSGSSLVSPDSNNIVPKDSESVKQDFSRKDTEPQNIDMLKAERASIVEEYQELKAQISEKKSSVEYVAFDDEIKKIRRKGSLFGGFEAVSKVRSERKKWADESGLTELQDRYSELSEKIHDYDLKIYKLEKAEKEAATIATAKKVKAFTNSEVLKYQTAAEKKFGTTNKFDNAGYLMSNGKLLDFSDGQGYRVLDHREIKYVLDFLPEGHNYSDGLVQFMNMGNIRMQIGGIDISKAPNEKQIPVLKKFFDQNNGEITVDFSKENGDNAGSVEYPQGTSSSKILNDIRRYFETGELPHISTAAAFHSRYSTKDTNPIQAHYAEVLRENRNLKQIISALDEMNYSSVRGNVHLDGRDIFSIAGKLIKQTSSSYDRKTLADELTVIYDFMANSGKTGSADSEAIYTSFLQIANNVLEKSETKDSELWEQYKEVREYLRNQPIYITPQVKKEIASQFGEYKSFRNLLMGKVNRISTTNTEARTLDEVWQELSEKAPEYFPKDANELDMPMYLTAFYDAIAPKVVNPYEHYSANIEEEAALLATSMFEEYFKVGKNKSEKEKYRDLVFENMQKLAESKKALKAEFKNKADEDEQRHFDNYRARVAEYKQQRKTGDRRRRLRNELERNYNYLNRRIMRETDNDHIPENLKPLAEAFKNIVPDRNRVFSKLKFADFENEYRKLQDASPFFDEDMADKIGELSKRLTATLPAKQMRDLDNFELETLRDISEHIKYVVQNENRLFSDRLKGQIASYAQSAHGEMQDNPESKVQGKSQASTVKDKFRNSLDSFMKGLTKPEYLFGNLGSETLKTIYDEIRRGENTETRILFDAKEAEREIKKKNHYDTRWETQKVSVKLGGGVLNITTEQLMSLYASSKRNQAREHMLNGGVIIYTVREVKGKNGKTKIENKRERFYFNEQDLITIQNALTADQKNYVDEMVGYITTEIGSKRNEISMKLFGIEKYKEKYYFPISVDEHFLDSNLGKPKVVSTIKNQSSAKRTTAKAHNPIEISGFTETVNNHIYDSALYCAYVLPVSDFKRVYNYRDQVSIGEGVESLIKQDISIKEDIRRTKGVNAIKEIEDFMVALDSGSRYENIMPLSAKLAARAKKTAVMANLSVVVQQPTAVFRSMLYISPKHFATWVSKADIAEMKKWNGCALKKEIGYFDVNMGRSATDFINEYKSEKSVKEDWNAKDYLQRLRTNGMQAIDEVAGWGASKADEMTWGAIWNACKKQTKEQNPSLSGDALNAAASELFQTVISKTQVYDSVFTKPEYMRRKEGFSMMATQFMSEPLTSLNMLAEAVANAKNAPKNSAQKKTAQKFCGRAFACYVTSIVINSALKSLIYTMRDDDEEKSFLEKYVANVVEGIATDPIGMIPYVKDILSLMQGYDLSRIDVAAFSSFKDAVDSLGSDKKTPFEKIMAVLKAAGQASGIPLYAVVRDGNAILNVFNKIVDGVQNGFEPTTGKGVLNELKEVFDWLPGINPEGDYEQLYNAILSGDTKHYEKVYNNLIEAGLAKDKKSEDVESTIVSEVASLLAKNDERLAAAYNATAQGNAIEASNKISELKEAGFSEDIINTALRIYKNNLVKELEADERVEQAAQARYDMDYDRYESLVDEMVSDGYSEIIVKDAVNSAKVSLDTDVDTFTIKEKDMYMASYDLKNAIVNGNSAEVKTVHENLAEQFGEEKANDYVYEYAKQAYKDGELNEAQVKSYLTQYKDVNTDENDIFWIMEELKGGTDYKKYGKLYDAIDSGRGLSNTISYYASHGVEISTVRSNITKEYKPKLVILTPGTAEYNEMYNNVIDAIVATGKSEAEAIKQVNKWFE